MKEKNVLTILYVYDHLLLFYFIYDSLLDILGTFNNWRSRYSVPIIYREDKIFFLHKYILN